MIDPGLTDAEMIMVVRAYNAAMSQPSQITEAGGVALIADMVIRKRTHYDHDLVIEIDETHFIVGTNNWAVELEPIDPNCKLRLRFRPLRFILLTSHILSGRRIETELKLTLFSGDPIRFAKDLVILKMFLPET